MPSTRRHDPSFLLLLPEAGTDFETGTDPDPLSSLSSLSSPFHRAVPGGEGRSRAGRLIIGASASVLVLGTAYAFCKLFRRTGHSHVDRRADYVTANNIVVALYRSRIRDPAFRLAKTVSGYLIKRSAGDPQTCVNDEVPEDLITEEKREVANVIGRLSKKSPPCEAVLASISTSADILAILDKACSIVPSSLREIVDGTDEEDAESCAEFVGHLKALAVLAVTRDISREEWHSLLSFDDERIDVFLPFARLYGTWKYTPQIKARSVGLACMFHVNRVYDIVTVAKKRKEGAFSTPCKTRTDFRSVLNALDETIRENFGADLLSVIFEVETTSSCGRR